MNIAARNGRSLRFWLLSITLIALVAVLLNVPLLVPQLRADTDQSAAIGNRVWFDANADGIQNPGEPGLNGVEVTLTLSYPDSLDPTATAVTLTAVTTNDHNGNPGWYSFNGLLRHNDHGGDDLLPDPLHTLSIDPNQPILAGLDGTLVLNDGGTALTSITSDSNRHAGTLAQPVRGLADTAAREPVTDEPEIASYDFGYAAALSLGGTLWNDSATSGGNEDSQFDPDQEETLAGVTVQLWHEDAVVLPNGSVVQLQRMLEQTVTNANGFYLFNGLAPGEYIVRVPNVAAATGLTHSAAGSPDADGSADRVDKGYPVGTFVQTHPVTIEATTLSSLSGGSEPQGETENPGTLLAGQDARANLIMDLGFTTSPTAVGLNSLHAGEQTAVVPVGLMVLGLLVTGLVVGRRWRQLSGVSIQ